MGEAKFDGDERVGLVVFVIVGVVVVVVVIGRCGWQEGINRS